MANTPPILHRIQPVTRREMLVHGGAGFGALALSYLLGRDRWLSDAAADTSSAKLPQARATSVIFLFMEGGPSHIDLFDPKPRLEELAGQPLPESFGTIIAPMGEYGAPLMASKRTWKQYGENGTWVSDWLPHLAGCVDDIAVIRSCWADGLNHSNGVCQMNTGSILGGRPSLGAWVHYGLGTANDSLPVFVVMEDNPGRVVNGPRNWGAGFMPASYQGTAMRPDDEPIRFLEPSAELSHSQQRAKLDVLNQWNRQHMATRGHQTELEARIESYELAFRMQSAAPEAVDLTRESDETQSLYGMDQKETATFGRQCLLARRFVERGVRFVQLYHGSGSRWDAHSGLERNHAGLCREMDRPVAGLIQDLKRRGLLDQTLVVWGGEFGRSPVSEQGDGRDHNPYGFTMWMAGAGIRGGQTIGATDEIGLHAVENRLHVHDLHATILHLMGLDHMQLTYFHKGRPERPTINEGEPCSKLLAG